MNPTGKIRVVPLLVDAACGRVFLFALLVAIVYPSIRGSFRSRNVGFLAIISVVCLAFGAALVRVSWCIICISFRISALRLRLGLRRLLVLGDVKKA